MAEGFFGKAASLFGGLKQKAADTVAQQEANFVRGQVAGTEVRDDVGFVLVDAGQMIDDQVIERARAAGKIHKLVGAVTKAQTQDVREKIGTQWEKTQDGKEAAALNSAEDYAEARRYVGRVVGVDVTDIRGTVLVAAGQRLKEDDVRVVREAGQLGALLFAMQQPYVVPENAAPAAEASVEKPTLPTPPVSSRLPSLPRMSDEE